MATHPRRDVPSRGTQIYLAPREAARPVGKAGSPGPRPSRIQRMTFIFGVSAMMWIGIAALVVAL